MRARVRAAVGCAEPRLRGPATPTRPLPLPLAPRTRLRAVGHPDAVRGINADPQVLHQQLPLPRRRLRLSHQLQVGVLQRALGTVAQTPRAVRRHGCGAGNETVKRARSAREMCMDPTCEPGLAAGGGGGGGSPDSRVCKSAAHACDGLWRCACRAALKHARHLRRDAAWQRRRQLPRALRRAWRRVTPPAAALNHATCARMRCARQIARLSRCAGSATALFKTAQLSPSEWRPRRARRWRR